MAFFLKVEILNYINKQRKLQIIYTSTLKKKEIKKRINEVSDNLTSLSIFNFNIKQFLLKYHILPTLIWTPLVLLRSKQRKYKLWKVYSPEQNGTFCDCFSSCKTRQNLHLKAEIFSFHSKYFVYRKLDRVLQKSSFCLKWPDTGTDQILGNMLYRVLAFLQEDSLL